MKRVKALLTFRPEDVGKPVVFRLVRDFGLWVNILQAEIGTNKTGRLIIDLEGDRDSILRATEFLKEASVEFRFLDGSLVWDETRCVHCGICTSVCPSGSLQIGAPDWELHFDEETCYLCRLCVSACPVGAITIGI